VDVLEDAVELIQRIVGNDHSPLTGLAGMVDDHLGAQGFSEPRFEGGDIRIPAAAATAA
jgi:hypothetical protein